MGALINLSDYIHSTMFLVQDSVVQVLWWQHIIP